MLEGKKKNEEVMSFYFVTKSIYYVGILHNVGIFNFFFRIKKRKESLAQLKEKKIEFRGNPASTTSFCTSISSSCTSLAHAK